MSSHKRLVHAVRPAALVLLLGAIRAVAGPQGPGTDPAPALERPVPAEKTLSAADAGKLEELHKAIDVLWREARFHEAIEPARQSLAMCERTFGADHWRTAEWRRHVETFRAIAALPAEGQRALSGVPALEGAGNEAYRNGRYEEAANLIGRCIEIRRQWLGERHPFTAAGYSNLADLLRLRGDLTGAEAMHRRALATRLAVIGERHPDTATSYNNLATVLHARGDLIGAEAMLRKALAVQLAVLGERHPSTANSYNGLATMLRARGDLTGAEAMLRKALAVQLALRGERHRDTAITCSSLALVLGERGDLAGAEAMHRKALAIYLVAVGERHPDTSISYSNLAGVLHNRGDLPEAEAVYRKAWAIQIAVFGERHPATANSYTSLAAVLHDRGDLAGAEAMRRKALGIQVAMLGEGHPETVGTRTGLGLVLAQQGRSREAIDALERAARASIEVRKRARGLEDAAARWTDPYPALAVLLARAGEPRDAWVRWERGLSRALLDEVAGRAARPLTPDEREREAALLAQAQATDERINRLLARGQPTPEAEKQLDALRTEGNEIRGRLLDLQAQFERRYGPLAGQPATLESARLALDGSSALVGWLDLEPFHYACIVRRSGDPVWVQIPGGGQDGAWTKDERALASRLRAALTSRSGDDWRSLAGAIARHRLAPLEPHLASVHRLIVVNSPGLAGLPVEVLLAAGAQTDRPAPVVSYAPSASMFTYLRSKEPSRPRPETLLAVGDPAYPEPKRAPHPPDPHRAACTSRASTLRATPAPAAYALATSCWPMTVSR
jgi:tetratricopeptide (TPR) repeat protein